MNTALVKPQWGPLSIALMVLGFVVWWPLGLAVLAYILWGEIAGAVREGGTVRQPFAQLGGKLRPW